MSTTITFENGDCGKICDCRPKRKVSFTLGNGNRYILDEGDFGGRLLHAPDPVEFKNFCTGFARAVPRSDDPLWVMEDWTAWEGGSSMFFVITDDKARAELRRYDRQHGTAAEHEHFGDEPDLRRRAATRMELFAYGSQPFVV